MVTKEFSSFRDESGFVYYEKGKVFRKIGSKGIKNFTFFINSGLSEYLINKSYLISYDIIESSELQIIIEVKKIPYITYSHEWSFSMLRDSAILTLEIQKIANKFGMTLKDATSYNVQFIEGKPIFIDLSSFIVQENSKPWNAYQQFCRHFLGPLALMSKTDISLNNILKNYIDGIPISLTNKLLPFKSKVNLGIFLHLVMHNNFSQRFKNIKVEPKENSIKKPGQLIDNLIDTTQSLKYCPINTEWADYYEKSVEGNYLEKKKAIFIQYLKLINSGCMWDIGANNGYFSQLASKHFNFIIASDIDPAAIEKLYLFIKNNDSKNILPLVLDITNTGGGYGWGNLERLSIFDRIKVDSISALALIHHLRITYLIPLNYLALFFSKNCTNLIIEFIPKSDEKVQILLQNREDIFDDYSSDSFLLIFSEYFQTIKRELISDSGRELFLFKIK